MPLPQRDTEHHTYGEYLTWTGDQREELIDGIAYIKEPPAPSLSHQALVGELHYQIRAALEGRPYRVFGSNCRCMSGQVSPGFGSYIRPIES